MENLDTASKASPAQRSYIRLMAIKALIMDLSHEQVAALCGGNEDSVSRWVRRFNERGIDGLPVSPPRIREERTDEYRKVVFRTELVNETHWTRRKFHGYLTTHCQLGKLQHAYALAS